MTFIQGMKLEQAENENGATVEAKEMLMGEVTALKEHTVVIKNQSNCEVERLEKDKWNLLFDINKEAEKMRQEEETIQQMQASRAESDIE